MVTCPHGHRNPDDNDFCVECGAPLATPAAAPAEPAAAPANPPTADQPAPVPVPAPSPQPKAAGITLSRAQLLGAGLAVAIVVVALLGLVLFGGRGSPSRAANTSQAAVVTRIVTVVVPQAAQATVAAATPVPAVVVSPSPSASPTPTPSPSPTPKATPATPTPTPNTDTPADTVLRVGDTWKQGGLELTMTDAKLFLSSPGDSGISVSFKLTSKRNTDVVLGYTQDSFAAVDNFGRQLEVVRMFYPFSNNGPIGRDKQYKGDTVLKPGQTVGLPLGDGDTCLVHADIVQQDLTDITVTVTGISSITNARWRIPINH